MECWTWFPLSGRHKGWGLWVILRPSPYICAEWDFGGLPFWLLAGEEMELRTSDERYLRHVRDYYDRLMPLLAPLQIDQGGPVLMLQVENEYGSFGNDKKYLESLRDMMRERGITVPLFASDGPDHNMLSNTKTEGIFPTANFGSGAQKHFPFWRNIRMAAHACARNSGSDGSMPGTTRFTMRRYGNCREGTGKHT